MPVFKTITLENAKIGIWKLTEAVEELEQQIFEFLTEEEKKEYSSFKSSGRRREWLATRILLKNLRKNSFFPVIKYAPSCKPFLDDENIGISHSRDFVAIILSQSANVSIDVEKISNRATKIKDKFLSEHEKQIFDADKPFIATLLWSIKETVYKYYGQKELPFINGIKIEKFDPETDKFAKCILLDNEILNVNFLKAEDNILTFIS